MEPAIGPADAVRIMKQGPRENNRPSRRENASGHWLGHRDNERRTHFRRHASTREYRRERTLREWLGLDRAVAEFTELRPPARSLSEILPEVMSSIGMRENDLLIRIRERWPELVGPDAARETLPQTVRQGCLFVEVASPTWRFVLETQHRHRLQARLRQEFPDDIQDIRFVPKGRR
jgi:hypothetical protein